MLKFKAGNNVKVIANNSQHGFEEGEIVTITQLFEDSENSHYRADGKYDFWYVSYDELELVEENVNE